MSDRSGRVAIVDYGVGNLFSVARACEIAGLTPLITSSVEDIRRAAAVVLPGIGAFGDAMAALNRLQLVDGLRQVALEGAPLVGICLGMQLLMERSAEFGSFEGLGLIPGSVERLAPTVPRAKIPAVGWNGVRAPKGAADRWDASLLGGVAQGEPMYFVHSYVVVPSSPDVEVARTTYGGVDFCSALAADRIFGVQFHPERSGPAGLRIYCNLAAAIGRAR